MEEESGAGRGGWVGGGEMRRGRMGHSLAGGAVARAAGQLTCAEAWP